MQTLKIFFCSASNQKLSESVSIVWHEHGKWYLVWYYLSEISVMVDYEL